MAQKSPAPQQQRPNTVQLFSTIRGAFCSTAFCSRSCCMFCSARSINWKPQTSGNARTVEPTKVTKSGDAEADASADPDAHAAAARQDAATFDAAAASPKVEKLLDASAQDARRNEHRPDRRRVHEYAGLGATVHLPADSTTGPPATAAGEPQRRQPTPTRPACAVPNAPAVATRQSDAGHAGDRAPNGRKRDGAGRK